MQKMTATEMNFGPDWLRALTDGQTAANKSSTSTSINNNNLTNVNNNSSTNKSKILLTSLSSSNFTNNNRFQTISNVKHRYSTEEMLAYYNRSVCLANPPKDLVQHDEVYIDEVQMPLAFTELTQEEINLLSQNINCDFLVKKGANQQASAIGTSGTSATSDAFSDSSTYRDNINHNKDTTRLKMVNLSSSSADRAGNNERISNKHVTSNGFNSSSNERGNGQASRSNRNSGSVAERGGARPSMRNAVGGGGNIIFTRLSSVEDNNGGSGSNGSNVSFPGPPGLRSNPSVLNKKANNSRSNNDNGPMVSGNSSSNNFMPPWRSNTSAPNPENQKNENAPSWKAAAANSEAVKNWRSDSIGGTGSSSSTTSGSYSSATSKVIQNSRKDFFGDPLDSDGAGVGINESRTTNELPQQRSNKPSHNSNKTKGSKSYRRFDTSEQNDLFKSIIDPSSSYSVDPFLDSERDLFGSSGSGARSSSFTSANSSYKDFFTGTGNNSSVQGGRGKSASGSGRGFGASNTRNERNQNDQGTSSWSNSGQYHAQSNKYDRTGRTSYHHQNDRYHRSSSHTNDDDFDANGGNRFASSGAPGNGTHSDEDDYRRNSLPEWSLEDPSSIDVTRVGTFDASGAFHEAGLEDEENCFFSGNASNSESKKSQNSKSIKTKEAEEVRKSSKKKSEEAIKEEKAAKLREILMKNKEVAREEKLKQQAHHSEKSSKQTNDQSADDDQDHGNKTDTDSKNENDLEKIQKTDSTHLQQFRSNTVDSSRDEANRIEDFNFQDSLLNSSFNDRKESFDSLSMYLSSSNIGNNKSNLVADSISHPLKLPFNGDESDSTKTVLVDEMVNFTDLLNNDQLHSRVGVGKELFAASSLKQNNAKLHSDKTTSSASSFIEKFVKSDLPNSSSSSSSSLTTENIVTSSMLFENDASSLFRVDSFLGGNGNAPAANAAPSDVDFFSLLNESNFSLNSFVQPPCSPNSVKSSNVQQLFTNLASTNSTNINYSNNQKSTIASSQADFPFEASLLNLDQASEEFAAHQRFVSSASNLVNQRKNTPQKESREIESHSADIQSKTSGMGNNEMELGVLNQISKTARWFYRDPLNNIQGPFSSQEMYDWNRSGYFLPDLLVKCAGDDKFVRLEELEKVFGGQCPFFSSLSINSEIGNSSLHHLQAVANQNVTSPSPSFPFSKSSKSEAETLGFTVGTSFIDKIPAQTLGASGIGLKSSQSLSAGAPLLSPTNTIQQFLSSNRPTTGRTTATLPPSTPPRTAQLPQQPESSSHPFSSFLEETSSASLNHHQFNMFNINANNETQHLSQHSNTLETTQVNSVVGVGGQTQSNNQANLLNFMHQRQQGPTSSTSSNQDNQMQMLLNQIQQIPQASLPPQLNNTREQHLLEKLQQHFSSINNKQLAGSSFIPPSAMDNLHNTQNKHNLFQHQSNEVNALGMEEVDLFNAQTRIKKLSLDSSPQLYSEVSHHHHQPPVSFSSSKIHQNQQEQHTTLQPSLPSFLQKFVPTPSQSVTSSLATPANNIVPGVLSVTDVEELQRREAEEHYRLQQQQRQQQSINLNEDAYCLTNNEPSFEDFIEVDRKHKNQKTTNKKSERKLKNETAVQMKQQQTPPPPLPLSSSSSSTVTTTIPPLSSSSSLQHQVMGTSTIPQMPQLPKKAVWGASGNQNNTVMESCLNSVPIATNTNMINSLNENVSSQPLSIAEIQKLQEEKEREEMERQQELQQQQVLAASQQRNKMKWGSTSWQQQDNNVKTLAEIQAEEAEKQQQTALRQQEALASTASRQRSINHQTSLSVIVAKGAAANQNPGTLSWGSPKQPSNTAWPGTNDEEIGGTASSNSRQLSVNYKNAVAAASVKRVDSGSLKQLLKTNPKVIHKIEESQISKLFIENTDDLLRFSTDLLSKHFDSIDSFGFISIIKDLGSPSEVIEFCQSYLGLNPVSAIFSKWFIAKKTHLVKLKQEQERAKNSKKNNAQWSNGSTEDEQEQQQLEPSRIKSSNKSLNNHSQKLSHLSPHQIKTATLKTTNVSSKSNKMNDDVNMMALPVETMDEFDNWCFEVLKMNFELDIDAQVFVELLKDIDSPDEINEYVQTYLGSNKPSRDFAKNFITKRSYLRNKAKQNQPFEEDMCGPAKALTPLVNDSNGFVTVSNANKKKRNKNKNN